MYCSYPQDKVSLLFFPLGYESGDIKAGDERIFYENVVMLFTIDLEYIKMHVFFFWIRI